MDLQTFITETLVQIANGISEANVLLANVHAVANPRNVSPTGEAGGTVYGHIVPDELGQMRRVVQSVNFDVAISVAEGSGTKGGIGVVVGAIALGGQGSSSTNNASQSRVSFTVPMALPVGQP